MNFSVSLRRLGGRASSKSPTKKGEPSADSVLGFDLLHHLTYLSAISAAGIPRSQIFVHAARLPVSTAVYFSEIEHLARNLNYEYSEGCRIVGEKSKREAVKSLFLRLAGALTSGEPEADFLEREARIYAEAYSNEYESKLETLRKWTDAYAALVVSAVLIIIVAVISTIIYDLGVGVIFGLVGLMVALCGLGVWVIFRSSPSERRFIPGPQGLPSQRVPRLAVFTLVPGAIVAASLLGALGVSLGWVLVMVALAFLPPGILASRYDAHVAKLDREMAVFLRVVGATATAIGTTVSEALGRIDMRAIPNLSPAIRRLHLRLLAGASPELCWDRLVTETGSELIRRSVRIFLDGITLGGEAEDVGARTSLLAMKTTFLRDKRKLTTRTFGWLTIALHATVTFLLTFVIAIVSAFGGLVQKAGLPDMASQSNINLTSFFSLSFANMHLLELLMGPVVVALALVNALAPQLADGGYPFRIFFYLAITLAASGLNLITSPMLANAIMGSIPSF
ncbi:MAG: type II secretion system F family protein [Dehalococcoidia bacterium]